ncbi:hypothetical protein WJX84_001943 [Apatococcus fuscideae]|uniref:Uncharacterized protein n=1 Tax=Apatococcus fuscideae TaxID=2026836 RepID=A0AAW1SKN6_9CHLO
MQLREQFSLTQQSFQSAPLHIWLETSLAAILCLWGSLHLAGQFQPISALETQRGMQADTLRLDFMTFNHRASLMPMELDPSEAQVRVAQSWKHS